MSRLLRLSALVISGWLVLTQLAPLFADNGHPQKSYVPGQGYYANWPFSANNPTYSYSYLPAESVSQQPASSSSTAFYGIGPGYPYPNYQTRSSNRAFCSSCTGGFIDIYGPDPDLFHYGPIVHQERDMIPVYGPYYYPTRWNDFLPGP